MYFPKLLLLLFFSLPVLLVRRGSQRLVFLRDFVKKGGLESFLFLKVIVIVSYVIDEPFARQIQDTGSGFIDKIPVVAYKENSSLIVVQCILKNLFGGDVKVVGRLVKEEKVSL